jgi:hypothetical protein
MAQLLSDEAAEQFAKALVAHQGNRTQAAIACGYDPGNSAKSAGKNLARHPSVLKQLQPLVMQQLASLQPRAVQTIAGLLTNKSGYIRLEAAKDILNRMGVGAARDGSNTSPLLISIQIGGREAPLRGAGGGLGSVALPSPEPLSGQDGRYISGDAKSMQHTATSDTQHIDIIEQYDRAADLKSDSPREGHPPVDAPGSSSEHINEVPALQALLTSDETIAPEIEPGGPKRERQSVRASPTYDLAQKVQPSGSPTYDFPEKVFLEKVEGEKVAKVLDIEASLEDSLEDTWEL